MRLYWRARRLNRKGQRQEALTVTKVAYGILKDADRDPTFTETIAVVTQLEKFATTAGESASVRAELADALEVLRPIQADPQRRSAGLDRVILWIESRLRAT